MALTLAAVPKLTLTALKLGALLSRPYTARSSVPPTNTSPLAMVGVAYLTAPPGTSRVFGA